MVQLHCLWSLDSTNFWENCQGRRHACGSSLHSYELRGQLWEFPSTSISDGSRSSAGCAAAASFNWLMPQSIMGLTFVGAVGATAQSVVNTAAAGAARGGRNAELQWKCKHSDNAFRLHPGHCHHLSNPNVFIQQVGNESKHCEEGSLLGLLRWAEGSCWKIPSCMEMCRVSRQRSCVGFVRAKKGAEGQA